METWNVYVDKDSCGYRSHCDYDDEYYCSHEDNHAPDDTDMYGYCCQDNCPRKSNN